MARFVRRSSRFISARAARRLAALLVLVCVGEAALVFAGPLLKEWRSSRDETAAAYQAASQMLLPAWDRDRGAYLLPSDSRRISKEELAGLSDEELSFAENEILARYGCSFSSESLRRYFQSRSWYAEDSKVDQNTFQPDMLSGTERENLLLIRQYEAELGAATAETDSGNTSRKQALDITAANVQERLQDEAQERWYRFSVMDRGDVVLRFSGKTAGPYEYYWYMQILEEDGGAVVKEGNLQGDQEQNILLPDLQGEYLVQVTRAKGNPLFHGYTDDPYTLSLLSGSSLRETQDKNGVQLLSRTGDILCSLDGHLFVKSGDGRVLAAYYTDGAGNTGPILVGVSREAVDYYSTAWNDEMKWNQQDFRDAQTGRFVLYDTVFYYSCGLGFAEGTRTDTLRPGLYRCTDPKSVSAEYAAREALNVYCGLPADASFQIKTRESHPLRTAGIVVGIVLVLLGIFGSGSESYGTSSSSGSYSGLYGDSTMSWGDRQAYISKLGGLYSSGNLDAIQNDPSLSSADKDALKSHLRIYGD